MVYNKDIKHIKLSKTKDETITTVTKDNDKDMEIVELKALYEAFEKKVLKEDPNAKICVRVSNILNEHWTIKGFQDYDLRLDEYDEYLDGRVREKQKFAKFSRIQFFVHTQNNKGINKNIFKKK